MLQISKNLRQVLDGLVFFGFHMFKSKIDVVASVEIELFLGDEL